jgi:hypothetical protein
LIAGGGYMYPHLELHERYYYLESFKKMAQKDPIETKTFRSEAHRISGRE